MHDHDATPRPGTRARSLLGDARGLSTVEYVIALCLIGAVSVGMWKNFGGNLRSRLGDANALINKDTKAANNTGKSSD